MARVPGSGLAKTAAAVVFLLAVLAVAAYGLGGFGAPGGPSPSPTLAAEAPTPSPTEGPSSTPAPTSTDYSSPSPTGTVIAYTNPDGFSPEGYAGDGYPFIVEAQELATYGILWVDPNQRDFHLGLTGDIEGAIEALKDGIPRGITVYFYLVEHTQAEVCAIRDHIINDRGELLTRGILVMGGGCGNKEMTASISLSPMLPEVLAYMQERYPGPVSFSGGGSHPLRQVKPPTADEVRLLAIGGTDMAELRTCGQRPFPASALSGTGGAEDLPGPEYDALREAIDVYSELVPTLSSITWQIAEADPYGATFLARRGDGWLTAPVFASEDEWVPGAIDVCVPEAVDMGAGNAEWWLDPDYPEPTADSLELHLLINETACSSGSSPEGRILPPVVAYDTESLRVMISVRSSGGFATCPGNPALAVTIILPQRVGDRDLKGASAPPY